MQGPQLPEIKSLLTSLISQVTDAYTRDDTSNLKKSFNNSQKISLSDSFCTYEGTDIQIIECYKQVNSDICGFHCLFNLLQFLRYFTADSVSLKNHLTDGAQFWKCYSEIYNFLQTNYPNKKELKLIENLGPLERVHMEYLLENYAEIKFMEDRLQKEAQIKLFIQPFYYGFGIMQNSEEDLKKIQDLALSMATQEENVLMIYPLGITIHWSLLIICKRNKQLECFYLDSKNVKLEHIFKGEIEEAIRDLEEASKYGREEARNELDERRQLVWIKDLRKCIEILLNVIKGKKTLTEYTIEGNIEETLSDFNAYLSKEEDIKILNENTIKTIYQWFEDEYRPQVISNNLLKSLAAFNTLDKEHFCRLKEFKDICQAFGEKVVDSNLSSSFGFDQKLVEDILKFLEEIKVILSSTKIID